MSAQLTEFLLKLTFEQREKSTDAQSPPPIQEDPQGVSSQQILTLIYSTLNEEKNYKPSRNHRSSLSS